MTIPWTLLKVLSYPSTAIASAGSGALIMYFAKPEVDLEPENQKWSEEMGKLRGEIDEAQQKAKEIAEKGKSQLDSKQKLVNKVINAQLKQYETEFKKYADCLDELFKKISYVADNNWFTRLYYTEEERLTECKEKPKTPKYSGTIQ